MGIGVGVGVALGVDRVGMGVVILSGVAAGRLVGSFSAVEIGVGVGAGVGVRAALGVARVGVGVGVGLEVSVAGTALTESDNSLSVKRVVSLSLHTTTVYTPGSLTRSPREAVKLKESSVSSQSSATTSLESRFA